MKIEKLFVFNGSILINSALSGFALLADAIGKKQEMLEHQAHYYKVRKKGSWGLPEFAKMFENVSKEEIQKKANEIVKKYLRKDSKKLIEKLKQKGYYIVYYSTDPMEIAFALQQELQLDDVFGTELEYKDGKATGKLKTKFDRYDRAEKIKKLVEENNLKREDVLIVGDSITALPSKPYGRLIAFNTKYEELEGEANFEAKNLLDILKYVFILALFLSLGF